MMRKIYMKVVLAVRVMITSVKSAPICWILFCNNYFLQNPHFLPNFFDLR